MDDIKSVISRLRQHRETYIRLTGGFETLFYFMAFQAIFAKLDPKDFRNRTLVKLIKDAIRFSEEEDVIYLLLECGNLTLALEKIIQNNLFVFLVGLMLTLELSESDDIRFDGTDLIYEKMDMTLKRLKIIKSIGLEVLNHRGLIRFREIEAYKLITEAVRRIKNRAVGDISRSTEITSFNMYEDQISNVSVYRCVVAWKDIKDLSSLSFSLEMINFSTITEDGLEKIVNKMNKRGGFKNLKDISLEIICEKSDSFYNSMKDILCSLRLTHFELKFDLSSSVTSNQLRCISEIISSQEGLLQKLQIAMSWSYANHEEYQYFNGAIGKLRVLRILNLCFISCSSITDEIVYSVVHNACRINWLLCFQMHFLSCANITPEGISSMRTYLQVLYLCISFYICFVG